MKRLSIVIGIVTIAIFGIIFAVTSQKDSPNTTTKTATKDITLMDAHGIAVDRENSSKVYVATHTGLLTMDNTGTLQRVGDNEDDYMGFSVHPSNASILYTSGHAHTGGNLGFQKSVDGGKTWQKVSEGINGPVDFHSVAVNQANANIIYGVYQGQLQRSKDEGKKWELVNTNIGNIITLATNNISESTVYAGTTTGLYISNDYGTTWDRLSQSEAVTAIAIKPADNQQLYAYANGRGLLSSNDGGKTWTQSNNYKGDTVMHLATDPKSSTQAFLINQSLDIYKTADSGKTWSKVR